MSGHDLDQQELGAGAVVANGVPGPALALRNVEIRYGDTQATEALSFEVGTGEFVSLIGPSGCGKSSALRAMSGLIQPAAGTVEVNGRRVTGPRPAEIAYVFQDLALYPWRSARRNVEIALELRGVPRGVRRKRAEGALQTVGLADVADRFPAQLSGGMRQRVALARALVSDASILLFDEPFAALDEYARTVLGVELLRLLEQHGKTVVFVTHSLREAAYLSDRVLVMSQHPGRITANVRVTLGRPRHPDMEKEPEYHDLTDRLFSVLYGESSPVQEHR